MDTQSHVSLGVDFRALKENVESNPFYFVQSMNSSLDVGISCFSYQISHFHTISPICISCYTQFCTEPLPREEPKIFRQWADSCDRGTN